MFLLFVFGLQKTDVMRVASDDKSLAKTNVVSCQRVKNLTQGIFLFSITQIESHSPQIPEGSV